ncbi:MATE family efflux transporter [Paenalcaligenes niemegkensis]|uniref:MATE family efflux transporter n=1 Tax=Paenalcaligenes niemegkensis TaxID=2895469 RepID=UPI001EE8258E|nr:MATE family efflux transporter [Paenalcaligenes niemegkensis]MCQ9615319.1 MATE family efflux transporter [Paenalcaligenes niemegkensis]
MTPQTTARLWLNETKASLRLGSPLILTNLAQVTLLTTNVVYMGRLGKGELAAGSLSGSLYQACMIFSLGLVSAIIPMLATSLGKQRDNLAAVQDIVRHGFFTAFLACIPFWILLWHADSILLAAGQNPVIVAQAMEYMHALQWSLLPYLGYIVLRSLLSVLERPFWTLIVAIAAILLNALLGWILVFGNLGVPALGIRGAGISSFVASFAMFLGMVLVIRLNPAFNRYAVFKDWWKLRLSKLTGILRLGVPIAITFTLETLVFYAAVMMMGLIGDTSLAAHAIVIQICTISYMFPLGFGQVATIRVGLAAGRSDPITATRAGWVSYYLGVGCMGIAAIIMWGMPESLIGFFIDAQAPENRAVVITATQFIFFAALFQLTDGAQAVAAGMLRGLYDTRTPMLLALIGYWVIGMPAGALLAFGFDMGGVGIWIGLVCGLTVVAILLTLRWMKHSQRLHERTYVR